MLSDLSIHQSFNLAGHLENLDLSVCKSVWQQSDPFPGIMEQYVICTPWTLESVRIPYQTNRLINIIFWLEILMYWISHVHVWERLLQKIDFCLTLFMNMNWLLFSVISSSFQIQRIFFSLNSLIYHPSPWKRVPFGRIINQASSLDPLTAKFKEAFSILLLLKCRIKLKNIQLQFKLFPNCL